MNNLILQPKVNEDNKEETQILIPVDGKSIRRLQREIISAYIKDYKSIVLTGDEIKNKAKDIQNTIQNLMALEVMEQTSKKIVAKDFLDMKTISIFNLIRKIDIIIRAMIEDCEDMFKEDNHENIFHRDKDINRLTFLSFRIVEFGLNNISLMHKKYQLKSHDLLNLWWFVFNLEGIGDDVKRIARYMRQVKLDQAQKEDFLSILSETKSSYLKILKGFHNKNGELVHEVLEAKEELVKKCEKFYNNHRKIDHVGLLTEKLKSMVNYIHNLGRVIYQSNPTKE